MFDAKYEPLFIEERTMKEIDAFWEYFLKNETKLIESLYTRDKSFLKDFEERLNKVFFRAKKGLRFEFHKVDNQIIFTFYYGWSSYLMTVASSLFEFKPKNFINNWVFDLQK